MVPRVGPVDEESNGVVEWMGVGKAAKAGYVVGFYDFVPGLRLAVGAEANEANTGHFGDDMDGW